MADLQVNVLDDHCTGCGACIKENICFVRAISIADSKASIDGSRCKGCGRCAEFCPHQAIEVTLKDPDYFDKAVRKIDPLVDITAE